jgi:integrase
MLATGVRIGKALAAQWPDVDLGQGSLTVDHTIVRLVRVGLVRRSTTTAAGERTLLLPATTVAMLRRRLEAADDPTGPMFPDSAGGWRDPSNTRALSGNGATTGSPGSPRTCSARPRPRSSTRPACPPT